MNKRIMSVFLCFGLLFSMVLPAYADETEAQEEITAVGIHISGLDEFLEFAENCRMDSYSQNLVASLESDIDLSNCDFESIPIFSGTFNGNGHSVTGLNITADGSAQGLFRYLSASAVVQDLNILGDVHPGGSRGEIGGLAGRNEGSILNCSFSGSVSGSDSVGGLVGSNTVTGVIENCSVAGEIHGNHFVGGIAGENNGVIRNCTNKAEININAQQNSIEISEITMDTLTNSEAVNTVTDIGGIAGTSSGVIRGCENRGNVGYQHMGYNIGGIAGTQSGYLVDCQNFAQILGRKEVGGIVGQMEPVSFIEYSEDTLQILKGQLSAMSGLVGQASHNAQSNANQISGQIGVLQDQAQTARDAVAALFPNGENSQLPDLDSILAAQNTLSSTINAMPGTLNRIASATQTTVSGLTRDLQAISGQINAMGETINGASENLGGSITDVSDQDTAETLTGKVESCTNYGSILADLNAGGIAGAMAMENDLDILEDWQQIGEESLNFESEIRAVVLNCENQGTVTGKKQNAGGIVGWQSMGLVKNCINTGTLDAEAADYVGGISGLSTGFIRGNHAKCEVYGSAYIGGIAGSAAIVTDCRSMVVIHGGNEKLGEILGNAEASESDEENPVSGNFYLSASEDIGAIDGISYAEKAEPLELNAFLLLENLPERFRNVTLLFRFEDGTEKRISVTPGGKLAAVKIPAVPEKDGYIGQWEGLDEADLSNIVFDMTFEAVYTAHNMTIQSQESRENGLPILLVQGAFSGEASISVSKSNTTPALGENEILVESWDIAVSEGDHVTTARFLVPDGLEPDELKLLVCNESGQWRESEYTVDGSYIAFSWNHDDTHVSIVETESISWIWIAAGASAGMIGLLILLIYRGKKKAKKAEKPEE